MLASGMTPQQIYPILRAGMRKRQRQRGIAKEPKQPPLPTVPFTPAPPSGEIRIEHFLQRFPHALSALRKANDKFFVSETVLKEDYEGFHFHVKSMPTKTAQQKKSKERVKLIYHYFNRGVAVAEIGEMFRVSRQRIDQIISPEKHFARQAVTQALKNGRLVREKCRVCSSEQSEAHHPDYSKPLEIMWLCKKHHMAEHVKNNTTRHSGIVKGIEELSINGSTKPH